MRIEDIKALFKDIETALINRRLNRVIAQLENLLLANGDWTLSNRLEQIKTTYQYMVEYLLNGVKDPERKQVYHKLITDLWGIVDQLKHRLMLKSTTTSYLEAWRHSKELIDSGTDLSVIIEKLESFNDDLSISRLTNQQTEEVVTLQKTHEKNQELMFNCIWSNTEWTIEEQQLAVKSLQSKTLLIADKCLMVSAVTMSLLQCFDEKKIHFLLDAVDSPEISISVRAMTGIIFTTKNYSQRIELYPELIARLQLLKDDKDFGDLMARIYIQLLQTKNTPNLTDKIQNEILPEMMDGLKNGLPGSDEDDSNPEWKRFSPKLTEKIQKIQDLMMEGADVYVQTFSMLKRFPFFNSVSNWFLPYFPQHSLVSASVDNDPENEQVMDIIMNSSGICDSDKYSMLCVFPSIPAGQRNLIMSQFTSEENRELIEENQEMLKEMSQTREALSNNYIHCIYRFFKFYNKRHEFHDIFNDRLDFYNSKLLSDFLTTPERLKEVYESMMKGEMYSDACRVFEQMDRMNCMSETDLQKAAYCEQKSKNYKMALAYLHRVEEILPSDLWTIRHLATCHRKNKEYEEALRYYHKAGVRQPENLTIAYHTAQCLVELERYDEALQPFFQIDLTTDDDPKVCRGIAKCSFMIQKEDQAQRYLNKINPESRQGEDYILEGHIYLLTGDKRKALECYQMGANMMKLKETAKDFNQEFEQTIPKLLQRGLDLEEIQMIRDLVN